MNKNFEQLMQEVSQITASGLPIMEGKEKLEVKGAVLNSTLTVEDFGYMKGEEGEYAVITLKEYPQHFIYGSSVVTQAFKSLEEKFNPDEVASILSHGLTFKLTEMTSKNKRKYIKITFFPK